MKVLSNSRRDFIRKTALVGISVAGFNPIEAMSANNNEAGVKTDQLKFLFQGDSITDGNRGRGIDPNHILGHGYAFSIAGRVGATFPEKDNLFYNRGISGNKITDLAQRWQTDTLDLKPDILSILIGVNDASSMVKQQHIVTVEKFEEVFRSLLDQTHAQLPDCLFVLCEPFIMPVGKVKEDWNLWNEDMRKRQAVVSRLAKEYKTVFVPLQKVFSDASSRAADDYWIWDGIHPTYSGHELITREWLKQVSRELHFLKKIHF